MNRSLRSLALAAALGAAVVSPAQAATSVDVEAFDNATIQPAGPRSGNNGLNFFNIEGADNGNFASYGVARFDLAAAKAGLDADLGAGAWGIERVELLLTQSNAGFTRGGDVTVYFSDIDTPSPLAGSGLQYANRAADFTDAVAVLAYTFTEVATGSIETHALWDGSPSAGGQLLLAGIGEDDVLTLVLAEGDPAVAATYAGFNNGSLAGPTLRLTVSAVPEPASVAMLLAGLGALGLAARRRR